MIIFLILFVALGICALLEARKIDKARTKRERDQMDDY